MDIDKEVHARVKALMGRKFSQLIDKYIVAADRHIEAIRSGYDERDIKRLIGAAHALKSSSGNLGFHGLYETANAIEALGNKVLSGDEDVVSLDEMVEIVSMQYSDVKVFLGL